MIVTNRIFSFLLISIFSISISAQEIKKELDKNTLDDGTINEQLEYIIKKSNRYQHYKVVERTWLDKVQRNVADTVSALQSNIDNQVASISNLKAQINKLDEELASVNENLNSVTAEKDSMVFFGMPMSKGGYNITLWSFVGLFALAFLIFLFKFRKSNSVTRECRLAYNQVQNEFESFRKKSREKEQVLKRELQNELNKQMAEVDR